MQPTFNTHEQLNAIKLETSRANVQQIFYSSIATLFASNDKANSLLELEGKLEMKSAKVIRIWQIAKLYIYPESIHIEIDTIRSTLRLAALWQL